MQFVILAVLAAMAIAAPQYDAPQSPSRYGTSSEEIPILKDERLQEDDGRYSFDVETGNGIVLSQSGSPRGPEGAVVKAGEFSYTAPDGLPVRIKFVADENGYQPESDLLPVAPEFPHPIPQFVLDQIAFAAEEDAARARGKISSPSASYGAPQ
ncbi:cuticle protein AMP1A [Cherax quadricarinatus]|uniref:cuticle protein AMP1A n=1 Tax=Cherax quadricarinatus TaxID=27406 RepID=UPI00237820FF|nr:cuticle protein AMP1A-like [Cherax quadricarinatus]